MTDNEQRSIRPSRVALYGITGVVSGIAIHDQLTSGAVDTGTWGALAFLAALWSGRAIDWFGRGQG